jgi:hypothetical protein
MTALRHGGLVVDVPETWTDQSTLLLVAPASGPTLPTTRAVSEPVETVTIRMLAKDARSLAEVLQDEVAGLQRMQAGARVVDEGAFSCGLGTGARLELVLDLDGLALRQILLAAGQGDVVVLAIATTSEARLERTRAQLEAVLSSLRTA